MTSYQLTDFRSQNMSFRDRRVKDQSKPTCFDAGQQTIKVCVTGGYGVFVEGIVRAL